MGGSKGWRYESREKRWDTSGEKGGDVLRIMYVYIHYQCITHSGRAYLRSGGCETAPAVSLPLTPVDSQGYILVSG